MQTTRGTSLTDTAPARPKAANWRKVAVVATVALLVVALDQLSKWWALRSLDEGVAKPVIGDLLQLRLSHNPGMAFSLGTGYTWVLTAVALTVIVVCLRIATKLGSTLWAIALGLVLGGAIGNVTDRMVREPGPFRGHVVDFLELPHWPIFNVADSAITTAAVLFVLLSIRGVRIDGSIEGRGVAVDEPEPTEGDESAEPRESGR